LPVTATRLLIIMDLFAALNGLVAKIERWWIREIEVPANPDFDDIDLTEADYSAAMSGRMVFLGLMMKLAAGDDDEVAKWHEKIAELTKKR